MKAEPIPAGCVVIKGVGNLPLIANGAIRRVPRGEVVAVSDAERAYLTRAKIKFKG
ncbi:hypothetical protein ACHMW7_16200 [Aminobacter sp. UC22_36]|uniref:hypothetical protein n=1 Tax=Aminobacter sp. UC22_36 TaxID=3374549 RepID=UPI003756ACEF